MYTVSDVVDLGTAHKLILSLMKDWFIYDDVWTISFWLDEPWD